MRKISLLLNVALLFYTAYAHSQPLSSEQIDAAYGVMMGHIAATFTTVQICMNDKRQTETTRSALAIEFQKFKDRHSYLNQFRDGYNARLTLRYGANEAKSFIDRMLARAIQQSKVANELIENNPNVCAELPSRLATQSGDFHTLRLFEYQVLERSLK